jgi:hypothetical protein
MASSTFDVIDICEIFTNRHTGRSKNEIAASPELSQSTIRKVRGGGRSCRDDTGRRR